MVLVLKKVTHRVSQNIRTINMLTIFLPIVQPLTTLYFKTIIENWKSENCQFFLYIPAQTAYFLGHKEKYKMCIARFPIYF
jgi:hypothetical protein